MHQYTSHRSVFPRRKTIIVSSKKSNKLDLSRATAVCESHRSFTAILYVVRHSNNTLSFLPLLLIPHLRNNPLLSFVSKYIYGRAMEVPWLLMWCFCSDNNVLVFTEEIHLRFPSDTYIIWQSIRSAIPFS